MTALPGEKLVPFVPPLWGRGAHVQTLLGFVANRPPLPVESLAHRVDLGADDRLVLLEDPPYGGGPAAGAALLMHGLGGDADSKYLRSAAHRLREAGFAVFRMNHRGAGAGAGLVHKLYNCGVSRDVERVLAAIARVHRGLPIVAVGYSMSGNTLLKYLGERGSRVDSALAGALAVNPPIDVGRCVEAISSSENLLYHRRFARLLAVQYAANFGDGKDGRPRRVAARTIREFDAEITAPVWGFEGPDDYYDKSSARHVVSAIAAPTAVLTCDDDPFVPVDRIRAASWSPAVTVHVTRGGGHMGYFAAARTPLRDRRWLDYAITEIACGFLSVAR